MVYIIIREFWTGFDKKRYATLISQVTFSNNTSLNDAVSSAVKLLIRHSFGERPFHVTSRKSTLMPKKVAGFLIEF
jgi:hypothetical protein